MPIHPLHSGERPIDPQLVTRLLGRQFPNWAGLPLRPVEASGTDNLTFRLGDDKLVRLPRDPADDAGIGVEHRWVPRLAGHLPVRLPVPVGFGAPDDEFPGRWSVLPWVPGRTVTAAEVVEPAKLARQLAEFLNALHAVPADGPRTHRAQAPSVQDSETREALSALTGEIDTDAATAVWERTVDLPDWNRTPVWTHGDLMPGNLLLDGAGLHAVIDWSLTGIGDPAIDLIVAWNLLDRPSRKVFRDALDVDDATWARGRGWALTIGVIALPYYRETFPRFAAVVRHQIEQVLVGD